jgi:hypothetical protein
MRACLDQVVMLGLVPGIHALLKPIMGEGVDGRNKSGHDGMRG